MAAIKGAMEARRGDYELALFGAWQTERFARIEKLKPLAQYVKEARKRSGPRLAQSAQEKLASFHAIAAGGVPLKIERIRPSKDKGV